MPGHFDSKAFNAEAFKYSVNRIPNLKTNELKKSRALASNPDIAEAFSSQNGGNYAVIAMRGLLDGDAVNYDGQTDITATTTKTFEQGVVAVGRAKAWKERNFSYDITGKVDFMDNVAEQVAEYLDAVDQDTLLATLAGVFNMSSDAKSQEFVAKHTYDVTGNATATVGATTLNSAINKACGANKSKFSLVIMHSDVATNLENLNVLEHLKYTSPDGITRDLDLGTWNGRTVLIDDAMPLTKNVTTAETKGVYTITIGTKGIAGDKITIGGVEYTFADSTSSSEKTIAVGSSANTQATQLKNLLAEQYAGIFSVSSNSSAIVLTQIIGGTGEAPTVSAAKTTSGTIAASIATTTAGVAEESSSTYITYALGTGAISYEDIGVQVPYEMDRDPAKNGGEDILYTRQRKVFAPFGISYTKKAQASLSPTNAELMDGSNWVLVHSGEASDEERTYINHKSVPICRIISRG